MIERMNKAKMNVEGRKEKEEKRRKGRMNGEKIDEAERKKGDHTVDYIRKEWKKCGWD